MCPEDFPAQPGNILPMVPTQTLEDSSKIAAIDMDLKFRMKIACEL